MEKILGNKGVQECVRIMEGVFKDISDQEFMFQCSFLVSQDLQYPDVGVNCPRVERVEEVSRHMTYRLGYKMQGVG